MKKFSKILVGLLVVVCIVEGFFLYRAYAIPSTTLQTARKINRIEQIIDKYYKGSVKKSELEDCTYKGLVAGLGDVYSTYYSEDDFKELEQSTSGVYLDPNLNKNEDEGVHIASILGKSKETLNLNGQASKGTEAINEAIQDRFTLILKIKKSKKN